MAEPEAKLGPVIEYVMELVVHFSVHIGIEVHIDGSLNTVTETWVDIPHSFNGLVSQHLLCLQCLAVAFLRYREAIWFRGLRVPYQRLTR